MEPAQQRGRPSRALRGYAFVALPLSAVALAWWLVGHAHGSWVMLVLLVLYGSIVIVRPKAWLLLLPAFWPIADLARWTGQIHVTESDALLLTTVACLSLRAIAVRAPASIDERSPYRAGVTAWAGVLAIAASALIALARGMSEFPPESFAAWTGYSGSMNAVRVAKGYLLPLLLLPFLHSALRREGEATFKHLCFGLALGLGTASLAALWERLAFPGLTDFSQDYRTTALFWEMHVGGAALDGWLALTVPFALYAAWSSRHSPWRLILCLSILAVGSYALLTTFSRGLYLALAVSGAALGVVALANQGAARGPARYGPLVALGAAMLSAIVVATLAFRHGGYRGAAAMLLSAGLTYTLAGRLAGMRWIEFVFAIVLGAAFALASGWIASLVPKGPYVTFLMAALAGALLSWQLSRGPNVAGVRVVGLAVFAWIIASAVAVPIHWGGDQALPEALAAGLLVALPGVAQALSRKGLWHPTGRGALVAGTVGLASLLAAAVFGSYYFHTRTSTVGADLEGRLVHWKHGASLIQTEADRWLGIGTGRYSEAYFWNVPQGLFPGTWQVLDTGGETFLRLGPPRHLLGFGEMFRVTQAVPLDVKGPFAYRARMRASTDSVLRVEVCRKHLLYTDDCVVRPIAVKAGDWQVVEGVTEPGNLDAGPWYAPRLASVSIDLDGAGAVDVDDLEVIDGRSRSIVKNGDFQAGPAAWFFSSDRQHLPWHAKNLALHLYIEQGILGVVALGATLLVALGRLAIRGKAAGLLAAVPLASLLGFVMVGLFDSLVDVPRLTIWLMLVLWVALVLRRHPHALRRKVRSGSDHRSPTGNHRDVDFSYTDPPTTPRIA